MATFDRDQLAHILVNAPAWARIGLTVRDQRMRERAADVLAATIAERLAPTVQPDPDQLRLPL